MTDVPAVAGPGGVVVLSPVVLPELLAALQAAPRLSREASTVVGVMRRAAVDWQLRRLRERSAVVPEAAEAGASPRTGGLFGKVIGVARASEIVGVSERRIRVLAATGELAARKRRCRSNGRGAARVRWEIDEGSCHTYVAGRRGVA